MLERLQIHVRKGQDAPLLPLCDLGLDLGRPLKIGFFRAARRIVCWRVIHVIASAVVLCAVLG